MEVKHIKEELYKINQWCALHNVDQNESVSSALEFITEHLNEYDQGQMLAPKSVFVIYDVTSEGDFYGATNSEEKALELTNGEKNMYYTECDFIKGEIE